MARRGRSAALASLAVVVLCSPPREMLANDAVSAPTRSASASPPSIEVLVSAAVSLRPALVEVKQEFAALRPGLSITLNSGASGVLVAQIEQGAAVDVFLSASPAEIDRLAGKGRVVPGSRIDLASNRLVVAVRAGSPPLASFSALADARFERIALGNPRTVPAGRYAVDALTHLDLWRRVEARVVYAEHVRQVLDYLARGEVDAGLVYRTDIRLLPGKVIEAAEAPSGSHPPIRYQGVIPRAAPQVDAARALLAFLASPDGQRILGRHGFLGPMRDGR